MSVQVSKKEKPTWVKVVARYQNPTTASIWQIINSFVPFFAVWALMALTIGDVPYILTTLMGLVASGFMLRIFIIQHDCGHGSFLKSRKAMSLIGNVCGVLTFTPYDWWRTNHAIHHAHTGDLDFRGTGDIHTMTLQEYMAASRWQRLGYRLYRHPVVIFLFGAPLMFLVLHRTPFSWKHARSKAGRMSIVRTDLLILALIAGLSLLIGFKEFVMIELPIIMFTSSMGVWMFYIQHQFEDAYWSTKPDWDYATAAMQGSSFFKLPKVLQWFTGNIGFHHIHHLSPRIPNYELERCHVENPDFQDVPTLTLWDSIKVVTSRISLWDEEQQKLINFREAHRREKEMRAG